MKHNTPTYLDEDGPLLEGNDEREQELFVWAFNFDQLMTLRVLIAHATDLQIDFTAKTAGPLKVDVTTDSQIWIYLLLSISYEVLFWISFCSCLSTWIALETSKKGGVPQTNVIRNDARIAYTYPHDLGHVRRLGYALLFLTTT